MAIAKWTTPGAISTNLASGGQLNSPQIATGAESSLITYDNSEAGTAPAGKNLYGAFTLKLASYSPTGGSVSLRVLISDGSNVADAKAAGDIYTAQVVSGAGPKIVIFPMVRIYPFSLRLSIINNSGASFATSGNELYVRPYNEEIV
jgi:hypothetical protein